MMMNVKTLVGALAMLSLASCSKNDVFDAEQAAANEIAQKKTTFENNFVAKYGQVAPTQSWDFSTNQQRLGTRGYSEIKTTTVKGLEFNPTYDVVEKKGKYYLDNRQFGNNQAIYDNVIAQLPNGKKYENVKQATLVAPSSSFTIYPISAQGQWKHDLFVKVGDADPVKVYSKTWTDDSRAYVNGDVLAAELKPVYRTETYTDWFGWEKTREVFDHYEYEATSTVSMPGLHIEAPVGTPIEIYLGNVKSGNTPQKTVGTSTGNVVYVDGKGAVPAGIEIREDAIIKYVGIEDVLTGGDRDYNDVVLAIVGNPDVPEEIIIEDKEYQVPISVTKRYMMEDLGSTDDFDFNDVVVDVTETTVYTHQVTFVDGVKESDVILADKTTKTQKAVVRHLGGILPFQLTIGNTTLPEMGSQATYQTSPDTEVTVEGWIPEQNNVSVKVKSADSQMYTTNNFPKTGAIPMIFACDPSVNWAVERQKFDFTQFPGYKGE
jgi:hypothetical protein